MADITKREILSEMIKRVKSSYPELANFLEDAVNEGKDIERTKIVVDEKTKRKREHTFRQRVPLSDDEAIDRAFGFLQSRLIELPLLINSAHSEFAKALQENPNITDINGPPIGQRIELAVELGGVGDVVRQEESQLAVLRRVSPEELKILQQDISRLRLMIAEVEGQ